MSITAAAGSLDTSWTELSTVAYTASTLATLSLCIEEVQTKLNKGTLSGTTTPSVDNVATWLTRAKQELAETRQFTWKRRNAKATLTAGTYRYSLPPDYAGGYVAFKDLTNDNNISKVSNHIFDTHYPDMDAVTNGSILIATVRGNEVNFAPAPDGSDVIEIEYERSGDDPDLGDFSWLPEIERFRCCDFAVGEAFGSLHQWMEADRYFNRWNYGLSKASRADGKKRWSQMGYRARSTFQG